MASDRAILVRDSLNEMIEGLTKDQHDREGAILACCIALAIEEIEKWMYKGEFTPSVVPVKDGNGMKIPRENDAALADLFRPAPRPVIQPNLPKTVPAWVPIPQPPSQSGWNPSDRMTESPAFKRLKAKAAIKPVVLNSQSVFDGFTPKHWDEITMRAFKDANKAAFVICVRSLIPNFKVPIKESTDYANRMIDAYPDLWGKDVQK